MRTSVEPQSVLQTVPSNRHSCSTLNSCTPVPCCTSPDHLTTTHSLNAIRARLRHASALLVTSCEVSVSVFCSLSWSLCSQCVAHADRSETSRGVSEETRFILVTPGSIRLVDVTGCGVGTSCGGVLWDRVIWYWTGSRYPGIQINRAQTSRT